MESREIHESKENAETEYFEYPLDNALMPYLK